MDRLLCPWHFPGKNTEVDFSVFFKWKQQRFYVSLPVTVETVDYKWKIMFESYRKTFFCLPPDLRVMKEEI